MWAVLLLAPRVALAQSSSAFFEPPTVFASEDTTAASDRDWNDVALRFNGRCVVDGSENLVSHEVNGVALSAGARRTNAVLLSWTAASTPPAQVDLTLDGQTSTLCSGTCGQELTLFSDFRDAFVGAPGGYLNTDGGAAVAGLPFHLTATWAAGAAYSGSCAVSWAIDNATAGRIDASTTLSSNREPLVGELADGSGPWAVPAEHEPIENAYPSFLTWVQERLAGCQPGSCADSDWYLFPDSTRVVDRSVDVATTAPLQAQPTCDDQVQDGDETGVDCGGSVCGTCVPADYVADYTFDGCSAADAAGGPTATFYNVTCIPGPRGGALHFNGTSAWVSVPNGPAVNETDALSVSVWVRPDGQQVQYGEIMSKGHGAVSGNRGWDMEYDTTGVYNNWWVYTSPASTYNWNPNPFTDGRWHHVVGVSAVPFNRLYIDGQLVDQQARNGTILTNGYELAIGSWRYGSGTRYFKGAMDDVEIFDRALSADEVQVLYQRDAAQAQALTP